MRVNGWNKTKQIAATKNTHWLPRMFRPLLKPEAVARSLCACSLRTLRQLARARQGLSLCSLWRCWCSGAVTRGCLAGPEFALSRADRSSTRTRRVRADGAVKCAASAPTPAPTRMHMRIRCALLLRLCSAALLASRERRCARPGRVLRSAGAVALRGPSARAVRTGSRRSSQRGRRAAARCVLLLQPHVCVGVVGVACRSHGRSCRAGWSGADVAAPCVLPMRQRWFARARAWARPWATGDHVALGQRRRSRGARVERNRQRRWRTMRRCSLRVSPAALAAFASRALPMQSR